MPEADEKTQGSGTTSHGGAVADVYRVIAASRPEDYDGHTEFARMTPRARLAWLDCAVCLIEAVKTQPPIAVAEDPPRAAAPTQHH